ncbi:MAG: Cu(I)-responsive transcriptional regulator [Hyphomicrobiaceae bacterium]
MNIGRAATQSGMQARTIRFYEQEGLIRPARQDNGYRDYTDRDVHKIRFLHRARNLCFSLDDCRQLLSLYEDRSRASADVKAITNEHLSRIRSKIYEPQSLQATMEHLVKSCRGDRRPDCPILDDLSSYL